MEDEYFEIIELLREAYKLGYETSGDEPIAFAGDPIQLAFGGKVSSILEIRKDLFKRESCDVCKPRKGSGVTSGSCYCKIRNEVRDEIRRALKGKNKEGAERDVKT
jgi:hypothetical protein